uniref:Integrator complex subunit 8 n=1 Tax=Callorhinchus milii TaxID=7868 RepID=A0A4W3GUK0_CALMI
MSAEAADREAVTSSRPCTPPQTIWFEFLLDEGLLEKHLQKSFPDPSPIQLINQFLEQASKPCVNEQNQVQPPTDNRRNRTLKLLALKVAAHLKWDLELLEKSLSVPVLNMLLNELLCVSKVPPGVKHVELDLASLPPTTAMAVLVYNRWAVRTTVQSSFPVKQPKPGPPQLNIMSQMQQEKELTETILKVLKEQAGDSILVLERALELTADLRVHTMRTLDQLVAEPGMANGEMETSTAGLKISTDEMHCQVCYDLGTVFFNQGSTTPAAYESAKEHFFKTNELLSKIGPEPVHCRIDQSRLGGYCQACAVLAIPSNVTESQLTTYGHVHHCIKSRNYQRLIEIFLDDNVTLSLLAYFRQSVLRELYQMAQSGDSALEEVCFKVCICNTVRDVLEGQVIGVRFHQLMLKPTKERIDFLLEACVRSLNLDQASENSKRHLAAFLKTLCQSLDDTQFVFMISSHELCMRLLKDEERKVLLDQMRKRSPRVNLCTKPLTVFYDIPASASVNIGQLEHQLILTIDSWRVRQILIELHGMTSDRQFWTISSKWEVPTVYGGIILSIKDNLTRDLVYVLMAKGLHCIAIKDFTHARQLHSTCLELVTEFSPKLRQVMLNEMLLLDISAHEEATGGTGDHPPADLASRVRGYLEMRLPVLSRGSKSSRHSSMREDIPLRQIITEECVAFLLNWKENEYLTLQIPPGLVQNNPYVKLGQLLAATCKELPGPKESRRTAKDLWDVVVQIFCLSNQHKRGNDGKVCLMKHRESTMEHPSLTDPLVLTALISLFVKLHNIVRDDIVNDVTAEHTSIWPTSVPKEVELGVIRKNVEVDKLDLRIRSWSYSGLIKESSSIYFTATNQFSAAMYFYLQTGAICSDFFNKAVPPEVYTDMVLKRMIRCCSLLNCHTQVAILCQFLREVDYMTAFKALQEQNSHDAMDSYYDYIWDITILEYLTHIHHKRGETDKRQIAIKAIGQSELNSSNPEEVLQLAAQKRKKKFLQAMAKLYF